MRGRLFNLFTLYCVVVSASLSFSFADLLLSLESSLPRRGFNGDVRGFWPGRRRFEGRLRLRRDVGRGMIVVVFSTGFSSLLSACSSATSFDSVVGDDCRLLPRLRRLNCGRGFNNRETVVPSESEVFSVVAGPA